MVMPLVVMKPGMTAGWPIDAFPGQKARRQSGRKDDKKENQGSESWKNGLV